MPREGIQLSARSVVAILAHIFGPSFNDDPRFGHGDPVPWNLKDIASGPRPEPWRYAMLNPQPLPPRELYAVRVADAHISELTTLDRIGSLFGGEVSQNTLERSLRFVSELDEICPRWPKWPKRWPPPPPPPWWRDEEMTATELFVFGVRILDAAGRVEQEKLGDALANLGEKALSLSMRNLALSATA
jgi:hypothetical protein